MLIKFGALIISQYIPTSDCYVTHLKLIHCYMTITSQLNWLKKKNCMYLITTEKMNRRASSSLDSLQTHMSLAGPTVSPSNLLLY